jgi:hypothetical protein
MQLGVQDLDRHAPLEVEVHRLDDNTHPAMAQHLCYTVFATQ